MPKFSIIVPVYNVEKYIEDCLKSIFNQSYKDFEVIVVNDGHCPCQIEKSEDTLCPCKDFYEGVCHCKLFIVKENQ